MRARAFAVIAALCVLVAACSATKDAKQASTGAPGGTVPTSSDSVVSGDSAASSTTSPVAQGASHGSAPAAGSRAGASATASGSAAGGSAAPTGPVVVGNYCQTAGQGVGIGGMSYGDCSKMANGLTNWINANGGAGGRQIKLVQVINDLTNQTPQDQQEQAACATLTEDKHVEIAETNVASTDVVWTCLSKKGVPIFGSSNQNPDSSFFSKYPLFLTQDASTDRLGATLVDMLVAQGYWKPDTKVGLVVTDHPWYRNAAAAMKRRATDLKVSVADEVDICYSCDSQTQTNQAQSGAAKFIGKGIDHVAFASQASSTFLQAAVASNYYPRLGLTSEDAPYLISTLVQNPRTWTGALSVGVYPAADVAPAQRPPFSARTQQCHDILEKAGQPLNNPLVTWQGEFMCDGFFMLKTVMDATGGRTDAQSISQAVTALGTRYVPAGTFSTFFGAGRHDGAQTYRVAAYDATCLCFKYTTPEQQMTPLPGQPK